MCRIFGIEDHPEAAQQTYLGLYAQQHGGQESTGMASSDESRLSLERGMGYVAEVFNEEKLSELVGRSAIGHVRDSTTGESTLNNAQPILLESWRGAMALAHNGNIVNYPQLRRQLEEAGAVFQSTADTEVILHLLAKTRIEDLSRALVEVLSQISGAYSLLLLTLDALYAIRDPFGFRPMCLGKLGSSYVVASETCAFDLIGATYLGDVAPGTVLKIRHGKLDCFSLPPASRLAHCIFEHVYASRPDSRVFGKSVYQSRYQMGRQLAREAPATADLVVTVPDSGNIAALGYADQSGIPFKFALIRNHYVRRTFIEPQQSIRHFGAKVKFNPIRELLEGKSIVLIDDSILRCTISPKIVEMVRLAGARAVHLRISSPPIISPCFYGIKIPTYEELIGANQTVEQIREHTGADTLAYLSHQGMKKAVAEEDIFCSACFDRCYPIPVPGLVQLEDS